MTKRIPPYSPEVRARAVRMVFDHQGEHASQSAAISSIAAKIGCAPETLRHWVRQAERDQGRRAGPTTAEHERTVGPSAALWALQNAQSFGLSNPYKNRTLSQPVTHEVLIRDGQRAIVVSTVEDVLQNDA